MPTSNHNNPPHSPNKPAGHTPGPWKVSSWSNNDGLYFAVGTDYPEALCNGARSIALTTGHGMLSKEVDAVNVANARLIAAAPELLEAAKAVYNDLQGLAYGEHGCPELAHDYSPNLHKLVAAITKATQS